MTIPDPEQYDRLFPQVRYALTTDIAYSILLAKAAANLRMRREGAAQRKAERAENAHEKESRAMTRRPSDNAE